MFLQKHYCAMKWAINNKTPKIHVFSQDFFLWKTWRDTVLTDYIIQYASECKQYISINTVIILHWGRTIWRGKRWSYLCSLGNVLNRQPYTACCDKQIQTSTESDPMTLQYWCSGLQYMYQAHKYRQISNCSHCKFVIYP